MSALIGGARGAQIILGATAAKKGLDYTQQYTKELFGYDFLALGQKILFFFAIAYIIKLYFDIVNGAAGFWIAILQFFRVNLPTNAPDKLNNFMQNGYNGITYWQVVKVAALILVIFEALRYYDANKPNYSPFTIGIFGLIIGFLLLISWDLFRSFTENQITKAGFTSLLQNNLGFGTTTGGSCTKPASKM